jgi:hypothetical protein
MKVLVKFSYVENEIPKRARKPRPVEHDDGQITVEVPSLTVEQAPVVGYLHQYGWDTAKSTTGELRSSEITRLPAVAYRFWNGNLYTRRSVQHLRDPQFYPRIQAEMSRNSFRGLSGGGTMLTDPPGTWTMTRVEREQAIQRWAQRWIIINGGTYKLAPTPYYLVNSMSPLGGRPSFSYVVLEHAYDNPLQQEPISRYRRALPVTCVEEVIAEYRSLRERGGEGGQMIRSLMGKRTMWRSPRMRSKTKS